LKASIISPAIAVHHSKRIPGVHYYTWCSPLPINKRIIL
jgi:hypothetical protein